MIDELRARGPFARSLLAVTVAQDVAVPILFAAVLLVSKTLVSRGALQLAVAGVAALQLAGSLAAGVALGALLVQYARLVRGHEAAWLAAAAFLAAAAARLLHLEPIFIGPPAGCYPRTVGPVGIGRRARVSRRGGLARAPAHSDRWCPRGGRTNLLPPGAASGRGSARGGGNAWRRSGSGRRDCRGFWGGVKEATGRARHCPPVRPAPPWPWPSAPRSEEHTSELQPPC